MEYKTTFENGVTIINTGDPVGGVKNKTGHRGITYDPKKNCYVAAMRISKNRAIYMGRFENIEDAIAIYEEAEKHRADGTLLQWQETLYGVTKRHRSGGQGK